MHMMEGKGNFNMFTQCQLDKYSGYKIYNFCYHPGPNGIALKILVGT